MQPAERACPSGLAWDQAKLRELGPGEEDLLSSNAHSATCAPCDLRREPGQAFSDIDVEAQIDRLHLALADVPFPAALRRAFCDALAADPQRAATPEEGCVSNLRLEQHALDELAPAAAAEVAAHLQECVLCEATTMRIQRGFDGDVDVAAAIGRITSEVAPDPTPSLWGRFIEWFTSGWTPQMAFSAAAVFLVVGVVAVMSGDDGPDGLRLKGNVKLQVFKSDGQGGTEILSNERLTSGDTVRFRVSVAQDAHVMIVGIEAGGKRYAAYPLEGERSAPLRAGQQQTLPGAVTLDSSSGKEWLHLVACDQAFGLADVKVGSAPETLVLPAGCAADTFSFIK